MKHIFVFVVIICSYLSVAVVGQREILGSILNSRGPQEEVSSQTAVPPIGANPVWSQRKHIATTLHLDIRFEALAEENCYIEAGSKIILPALPPPLRAVVNSFQPFRPRDPTLS